MPTERTRLGWDAGQTVRTSSADVDDVGTSIGDHDRCFVSAAHARGWLAGVG